MTLTQKCYNGRLTAIEQPSVLAACKRGAKPKSRMAGERSQRCPQACRAQRSLGAVMAWPLRLVQNLPAGTILLHVPE